MRKSVFILLTVFMACLLCKESENNAGHLSEIHG